MMTNELRPCPDCRHKVELYENNFIGRHSFNIECKNCGCRTGEYAKEHELIAAWNRRAAADGWIAVGERLPEGGVEVLLWHHREWPEIGMYHDNGRFSISGVVDATYSLDTFTHWRPLPPPPGSNEPAPQAAPDERRALGDELIAFCADLDNVEYYDDNGDPFCAFCGDVLANGVEHLPDCLHLRARALGGDE